MCTSLITQLWTFGAREGTFLSAWLVPVFGASIDMDGSEFIEVRYDYISSMEVSDTTNCFDYQHQCI